MALSRRDKVNLQGTIQANLERLASGDLSRREKIRLQSEIQDAFDKLNVTIDAAPDTAAQNEKLKKLIAGEYNSLSPADFLSILKEISTEIGSIEPIKPPTIDYIKTKIAA